MEAVCFAVLENQILSIERLWRDRQQNRLLVTKISSTMENLPRETEPAETTPTVVTSGTFGRLVRTVMVSR